MFQRICHFFSPPFILVMLLFCHALAASSITGFVTDAARQALPGVLVQVERVAGGPPGVHRTDDRGYYLAPHLTPGSYRVRFVLEGFRPVEFENVELPLDRVQRLDVQLEPEGPNTEVQVLAAPNELEWSTGSLSGRIDEDALETLPVDGRDVLQLAALVPGVAPARSRNRNISSGYGLPLTFAGSRPSQNAFYVDGISVADHTGATPAAVTGVTLGLDAVQEFSVQASSYGANLGRAAGGVVSAVTRSGSNDVHGSVFYLHRNDNLDARNFFDPGRAPEFRRHQAGGSAGFPVIRNRTFGFVAVEALEEFRGRTQIDTTLSEAARQGQLVAGSVPVDPAMQRLLQFYPRPNGNVFGDTALYWFENNLETRQRALTGRLDHIPTDRDRWSARYMLDGAVEEDLAAFAMVRRRNESRQQSLALNAVRQVSSALTSSIRAGFARTRAWNNVTADADGRLRDPELAFLPDAPGPGVIRVSGLTDFPGAAGAPDADLAAFTSAQAYWDLSVARGSHFISWGASVERTWFNFDSTSLLRGEFTFSGLAALLENRPARFRAQLPGSDTSRGFRQWITGAYLQDRWTVSPRLSLDVGFRLEKASVPVEVDGRTSNLDSLTDPVTRIGAPVFSAPRGFPVYPRLGVALGLDRTRRSVLRAGFGIYPELILSHYLLLQGTRNPPFFAMAEARSLGPGDFPSGALIRLLESGRLDARAERIPFRFRQPYSQQWQVSIEQELFPDHLVRVSYLGAHAVHLSTLIEDANLVTPVVLPNGRWYFPEDGQRPNPSFGMIRDRRFEGHAFYQGFQLESARRRPLRGLTWRGGYTLGKSIDDSSTTFAQTESLNSIGIPVNSPHFNRGLSNHDLRHRIAGYLIWEVPGGGNPGWRSLVRDWSLAMIMEASSGLPFSATLAYDAARTGTSRPDYRGGQRPDLNPDYGKSPVTGSVDGWFDVLAFSRPEPGFLGNLGRNTLIGPNYVSLDLALRRPFRIPFRGDDSRLELRLEAFNLLNRANLALPDPARTEVFTRDGVREDAGRITQAFPARELQIGLRWIF